MKIDARRSQEHQKENKIVTHKTDEDTKGRQKGLGERDMCGHLERQQIVSTVRLFA